MTDALYRHNGGIPAALPFDAFDTKGDHWTDLANSPEGREACGFFPGPAEPVAGEAYDPATHRPRWDGDAEAWVLDTLPPPPPPTQAALLAFASDWRWQREVGGVNVGGILVATDDRSKILLAGARKKAELDPDYTAPWKVGDDSVRIPAAQIIAMSDAQMDWVDRTFSAWDLVKDAIKAGVLKTEASIVAAFKTALGQ